MLVRSILIGFLSLAALSAQPPDSVRGVFDGGARFLSAEPGRPGRVVKNAPYSAEAITETTQTLPDGNRIHQSISIHTYRDSEGRTRTEQPLHTLNGLAPNANLPQVVFINDPVAGTNYALNPASRTASRTIWAARPSVGGDRPPVRRTPNATVPNMKTESLGHQTIEGVSADGTRTTMTIPAGQIGNDQPIQIVTETWYSPELQVYVLAKRSDPRKGDTVTKLSNVSRAEPPHALFEVPADFTVKQNSNRSDRGPSRMPVAPTKN